MAKHDEDQLVSKELIIIEDEDQVSATEYAIAGGLGAVGTIASLYTCISRNCV